VVLHPYGLKAWKREMSTPYALLWSMVDFTLAITPIVPYIAYNTEILTRRGL